MKIFVKRLFLILLMFTWVHSDDLEALKTPIFIPKQNIPDMFLLESNATPKLKMIINEKAKIGDIWYRLGQKFRGYVISEITPKSVTLKSHKKILVLRIEALKISDFQEKLEIK